MKHLFHNILLNEIHPSHSIIITLILTMLFVISWRLAELLTSIIQSSSAGDSRKTKGRHNVCTKDRRNRYLYFYIIDTHIHTNFI